MRARTVLILAAAMLSAGCAQLLAGGWVAGQALLPISEADEIRIGQAAAAGVLADPKTPPYPDPTVNAFVTQVGQRVAAQSDRPGLPYVFHVLRSEELNAFALPGGEVFVTTAALKAMADESQLAGVLGHELAHVSRKHGLDQLKRSMVAQGIVIAALGSTPQLVQQAGKIAEDLVLKGYGRDAENEADWYGVIYENAAGYDPHGLGAFLSLLAQKYGDTPKIFEPLSDHPAISERIAKLTSEIRQLRLTHTETDASRFLAETQPLR